MTVLSSQKSNQSRAINVFGTETADIQTHTMPLSSMGEEDLAIQTTTLGLQWCLKMLFRETKLTDNMNVATVASYSTRTHAGPCAMKAERGGKTCFDFV